MGWNHQPVLIDLPKVSHSHIEAARRKEKYVVPLEHVSEWRPPCKWEQIVCSLNHAFRAGFWAKKNWSSNYWKIKREKISLKNLSSGKRTALLFLKDESWGKLKKIILSLLFTENSCLVGVWICESVPKKKVDKFAPVNCQVFNSKDFFVYCNHSRTKTELVVSHMSSYL